VSADGTIRTTCPYCGVGCGLRVGTDGAITGDPDHPANRGRLCSKGAALGETLKDSGRLLHPAISGRRASWDEALDLIAGRFSQTIAAHGPDSVAFYVSGQFLTEDYYVANKLMKGFIGSGNIDTNSRLCMASSVAGHVRAFGEDIVPGCYEDLEAADLVVLVGSNMAWCHPVLHQRLVAARQERGTRIVVIDPRRTATCEAADLHLALRPGSDVAIFAGLLRHLAECGVVSTGWVSRHTKGLDAAVAAAPALAEAAHLADLPIGDLARFYDWFAATERSVTAYSQGVNQSTAGTDKVNAIINCHLATGRIGRPGMGPLSLTGQPNAMGGREVGGLANQLAAHMGFAEPEDIDRVRRFWDAPRMAERAGHKAVDLFDRIHDGTVKALWVLGTNPAASMPRAGRVREALARCPFVVVSDCWPTDTSVLADVVLPAAGWGEKDGTVTNSERRISRQRRFREPPGEARTDWRMLCGVAGRMGWAHAFAYQNPAAVFREHAALSASENEDRRVFDIGALAGLSDEEYERLEPVQWPLRCGSKTGPGRLFGDGRFPTPDGRARLVATPYRPLAQPADRRMPLVLNTGRVRDQWHTMTRTGNVVRLMTHQPEPLLDIHPADAEWLEVRPGGFARVESAHGTAVLRIRTTSEQRRGEVFAPMHWTDRFSAAGPIARLVSAETDPLSGQPELKGTPVTVTPVAALWHGLLLRRDEFLPTGPFYWARIPLPEGQVFELAGWEPLPSGSNTGGWVKTLLGAPQEPDLIIYADPGCGGFRYASVVDNRLDACLFLARKRASLPPREAIAAQLGATILPAGYTELFGARPTGAAAAGDAGRTVCACFGVGLSALRRLIAGRRLTTVAEIGAALRAGTNCGSCIPELKAILRDAQAGTAGP
jgi:assimilatory nitrate reductase catalytic subunit